MKDTFYFPHDYEPTSDPKMIAMLGSYGATGYGLYWRIVEMLHSSETHTLLKEDYIYVALSKQMSIPVEQVRVFVEDCVNIYKLFDGDDDQFLSNRVMKNIEKRKSISEMRSKAGKISAQKREEKSDF